MGILVTGSELRRPGETLAPGEIYESNGLLLATALQLGGAPASSRSTDDGGLEERAMERALLGFDMLIIGQCLGRPARPRSRDSEGEARRPTYWIAVGREAGRVRYAARPSRLQPSWEPVSVAVTFELFVRPAVSALLGRPDPLPELRQGTLATVARDPHRDEYVRATTRREGESMIVEPLSGGESHMIARAGRADALVVEAGEGELPAGEETYAARLARASHQHVASPPLPPRGSVRRTRRLRRMACRMDSRIGPRRPLVRGQVGRVASRSDRARL